MLKRVPGISDEISHCVSRSKLAVRSYKAINTFYVFDGNDFAGTSCSIYPLIFPGPLGFLFLTWLTYK